jgi:hypothetical protein
LRAHRLAEVFGTFNIGLFEAPVAVATHRSSQVNHGLAVLQQLVQGLVIVEIAANEFDAGCLQVRSRAGIADQAANQCALGLESVTE